MIDRVTTIALMASALITPGSAIETISSRSRASPVRIRLSTSSSRRLTNWESTLYLFREEYHVPLLAPEVAAVIGTARELGFAVLLAAGLLTRFAASGLFVLNIVAVISYYESLRDSPAALQDHLEWAVILALLMTTQVRSLTLDHFLGRARNS